MCGIFGAFSKNERLGLADQGITDNAIANMSASILHRGPDHTGTYYPKIVLLEMCDSLLLIFLEEINRSTLMTRDMYLYKMVRFIISLSLGQSFKMRG